MKTVTLYHAGIEKIEFPEVRKSRYTKDFSWGFYCTNSFEQARRWAERYAEKGIINSYSYSENNALNIVQFDKVNDEWLDFIALCRSGKIHNHDIVEGPMADDSIWNFVNDYLLGSISKEAFYELAKFTHPTHQISFHTLQAIECLEFIKSEKTYE